jgi:transcriptional regulator with XRE-family HTH domain
MKKKYYYKQLAQELGVAPMTIYYLINGYKGLPHYTMDKRIARRIAKATGKRPIEYIHPKVRDAYERAWPSLK